MLNPAEEGNLAGRRDAAAQASPYVKHQQDIAAMLEWLQTELEAHADLARAEPENHTLVQDLAEVRQRIQRTLAFLSKANEREIEEALEELRM